MKLGISIKIDVTKIDKERLFKGEKGNYLSLTTFIDLDELDNYGNNGFISQSTSKEEREQKVQTPILGNVKVFFNDNASQQQHGEHASGNRNQANPTYEQNSNTGGVTEKGFDDDIPFR